MRVSTLTLAATLALAGAGTALAADHDHGSHDHGSMQAPSFELPAACKAASAGKEASMKEMQDHMSKAMQGMSGQETNAQKGLQHAMMQMNGPMMQGMMAGDPDVAWICAMIPHHMGAIAMAQVGLKNGDNPEAKKIAERSIQEQEKSIKELTAWLDRNARKEGKQ
ncbi:DUF305 domain-containing protein [Methylobacterium fujisawaense]|uniref:DUF305 domain-containing protein n=1 Tax=Methylobacterium fujisawaense TaxID=107400 RepID=UPI002F2CF482